MTAPSPQRLLEAYQAVRDRTEALAAPLSAEDQTVQSMPDASPTKWHRAHTTWFFETFVLEAFTPTYLPYDPAFRYLFNSYYEAVGERHPRPHRGMITRPSAADVGAYRAAIDAAVADLIRSIDDEAGRTNIAERVQLGLHHEQQHQELLLMDVKHLLSLNPTQPAYNSQSHHKTNPAAPMQWLGFAAATACIGVAEPREAFAFDNESPVHEQLIRPFALADRLITAGEWLAFMADDGYRRPELWLSDGWHTRGEQGWQAPLYWRPNGTDWQLHTLSGTRPVDPNEPVCHVSFYEADAYATWANARLATEFEWEHAAQTTGVSPAPIDVRLHPSPSEATERVELQQMFGACWQWTESAYRPYPGYRTPPGAIGEYNGKFMINTMVLRGSSAFTPAGHARATYRNFFHPATRWHLSGVRLARDIL